MAAVAAPRMGNPGGIRLTMPLRSGGTVLFGLPLFHVGGALTQGLANLAGGGSLVRCSRSPR